MDEPDSTDKGIPEEPPAYYTIHEEFAAEVEVLEVFSQAIIGFSIPANTASWVLSKLMTQGRVVRSFLGIAGVPRALSRRTIRVLPRMVLP